MAVDLQLKTRSGVSAVNTALNGVVANAGQISDTAIDNATTPWPYGIFFYAGTFAAAPVAGAYLEVWAAVSKDGGTTYEDTSNGTSGVAPSIYLGTIPIDPKTTAQNKNSAPCALPPLGFKPYVRNFTGQPMPTSTGGLTMVGCTETGASV